ncbi:MAG: response regulator transcription factor [Streptomyces sp.]|nr:response regulator transcription factor [Streptomyces sp.]NUP36157.1 response regulator transcription factor [Streptomyces sp.]NUS75504.1 response regulator transcription factor [Streptomyces sp.]
MPGPQGVPRADIVKLLAEGHSNREIGRRLHTNPKRVGQIRTELQLPQYEPSPSLTLEQKWTTRTRTVPGGHMQWKGTLRGGMPNLVYLQRNHSARRIAFEIGHQREPVGRVLPGCGQAWCVAPEHATDEPMRRADAKFAAIFGRAA